VTRIDPARRAVVVGERVAAERRALEITDLHWLGGGEPPAGPLRAAVQVRHRGQPLPAAVECLPGRRARVLLDAPAVAAPGQAAVLYDGDTVLGGGWISPPPAAPAS
jgi:tRNA-specific 2-thiouridylase